MDSLSQKFKREILILRALSKQLLLHPLAQAQIKQYVIQKISVEEPLGRTENYWWEQRQSVLRYAFSLFAGFALISGTAVHASSTTHPGDNLYLVKQIKDKVELGLAFSQKAKTEVLKKLAQERIDELNMLTVHAANKDATPNIQNQIVDLQKQAKSHTCAELHKAIQALTVEQTSLASAGNVPNANILNEEIGNLKNKLEYYDNLKIENDSENQQSEDTRHEQPGPQLSAPATNSNSGDNNKENTNPKQNQNDNSTQEHEQFQPQLSAPAANPPTNSNSNDNDKENVDSNDSNKENTTPKQDENRNPIQEND